MSEAMPGPAASIAPDRPALAAVMRKLPHVTGLFVILKIVAVSLEETAGERLVVLGTLLCTLPISYPASDAATPAATPPAPPAPPSRSAGCARVPPDAVNTAGALEGQPPVPRPARPACR